MKLNEIAISDPMDSFERMSEAEIATMKRIIYSLPFRRSIVSHFPGSQNRDLSVTVLEPYPDEEDELPGEVEVGLHWTDKVEEQLGTLEENDILIERLIKSKIQAVSPKLKFDQTTITPKSSSYGKAVGRIDVIYNFVGPKRKIK